MDEHNASETTSTKHQTSVERTSERELVVTRIMNGPVRLVYDAWTKADLFKRWWVPASYGLTLLSCEMDVRIGGQYRLVFKHEESTMAFFGTYRDVVRNERLVWTNEEGESGETITTVTFAEVDGKTRVVVHDLYPTGAELDAGQTGALPETLDQLDELLVSFGSF